MNIKTLTRSFAAGILGPELYGRLDLSKFQTGLAKCLNWWTLPHGPVQNRPGFGYVLEAKDSTKKVRVVPFAYNTEQTFILEFGDQYIRWHTQGATLLETGLVITGISQADPGVLTYTGTDPANGDWMYLASIVGMTELNGRYVKVANVNAGANAFELTNIHGGANIDTTAFTAYTSGGTASRVYTLASPYVEEDLFDLHFVQSADVLTIVHPSYEPRELRRLSATSWTLTTISFVPTLSAPTAPAVVTGGPEGGTASVHLYKATALATGTLEESLGSPVGLGTATDTVTAITKANPGVLTTSAAHGLVVGDPVYVSGIVGMTELNGGYYYVNTVPAADTLSLKTLDGVVVDTATYTAYTSGGTITYAGARIDLTVAGNYVDIDPPAVSGAVRYNIYKLSNGLWGYIGQTDGSAFRDTNVTPDVSQTPPEASTPFTGTDNYPGAVGYNEQRRCFAGTNTLPQNFWATRSATENNLSYSIPTRDDDAISFRIAAREVNRIRHIVSLDMLLLLTSGGEWKVAPQNSDVLTPASAAPKQIAAEGASNVQPVIANNSVLYVQESGSRMRELKYKWETNGYNANDISILAPHLFDGYTIIELAYSKTPNKMVWAVRSDGKLLGLTYLPEHDVMGWHEHDTEGGDALFESVACVKEGSEHALYAVVKRTVNTREVRYIERLHTRQFTAADDAFFVDCGLTYDGAATTSITGLWHLEGKDVAVLADAAEVTGLTVTDGAITLPHEASVVHVGLPITADVQTLPLALEVQAFGQAVTKNINEVYLRMQDSSGFKVGPNFTDTVEWTQRSNEPYGTPPALFTGVEEVTILPEWGQDTQLCVRQTAPLPATILAMSLEVAVGE